MLELYHWEPVSHSLRALICLEEIGVEYRRHYVDLLEFEQFTDDFLAKNRNGQVPVLVHDGATIFESALISEYLTEAFPGAGLAPTDALGWYNIQTWSKYIDYNLSSSLATLGCSRYLVPILNELDKKAFGERLAAVPVKQRQPGWDLALAGDYPEELIANSGRKVELVTARMEEILAGSDWLVADRYSIADINTFALVHGLRELLPETLGTGNAPRTNAWFQKIAERPAVGRALAANTRFQTGTVYAPGPEHSRWG
jgi:glutathione S-transferase